MLIGWSNDGQEYDILKLIKDGFEINLQKDVLNYDANSEEEKNFAFRKSSFNFVGFLTNDKDNAFVVFPKGYKVNNPKIEAGFLFSVIQNHIQKNPDRYFGNEYGEKYVSNFPFACFYGIYNYYRKYGLYREVISEIKPNTGGEISWKKTIQKTNFYPVENDIAMFPFYYKNKYNLNTFITHSMIFAIDYTINKFHFLLNAEPTGKEIPEYDFLQNRDIIINVLKKAKTMTFKDSTLELLDNLIQFFQQLNQGGKYYFKSYVFEYLWEDMVLAYLNQAFKEINNNEIIFDERVSRHLIFKKTVFRPNMENSNHMIEPDYYSTDGNSQYIFDAKYKRNIKGMDYKQICYCLFLKDKKEKKMSVKDFNKTYSALIMPDEFNHSKLHFRMNPLLSDINSDILIIEQYLDIKAIINWYMNNS